MNRKETMNQFWSIWKGIDSRTNLIKMQTGVNEFEDFALCPICGDGIRVK